MKISCSDEVKCLALTHVHVQHRTDHRWLHQSICLMALVVLCSPHLVGRNAAVHDFLDPRDIHACGAEKQGEEVEKGNR